MVTSLQGVKIQVTCQDRVYKHHDREAIHLIHSNGPTGPLSRTWGTRVVLKINGTCWETPLSYPSWVALLTPKANTLLRAFPCSHTQASLLWVCLAFSRGCFGIWQVSAVR